MITAVGGADQCQDENLKRFFFSQQMKGASMVQTICSFEQKLCIGEGQGGANSRGNCEVASRITSSSSPASAEVAACLHTWHNVTRPCQRRTLHVEPMSCIEI